MRITVTLLLTLLIPPLLPAQDIPADISYISYEDVIFHESNPVTFTERIQLSYGVSIGITEELLKVYQRNGLSLTERETAVEKLLYQYKKLKPSSAELTNSELASLGIESRSEIIDILNYDLFLSWQGNKSPITASSSTGGKIWYGIGSAAFKGLWQILKKNKTSIEAFQQQLNQQVEKFNLLSEKLTSRAHSEKVAEKALSLLNKGAFESVEELMVQATFGSTTDDGVLQFQTGLIKEINLKFADATEYYHKAASLDRKNSEYALRYGQNLLTVHRHDDAIGQFRSSMKALASQESKQGGIGVRLNHIGEAFLRKNAPDRAIGMLIKALNINIKDFGETHRFVSTNLYNLSLAHKAKGEYPKALKYMQQALRVNLSLHGEKHPNTAVNYTHLGSIYQAQRDFQNALIHFQKALNIITAEFGPNHHFAASGFNYIASLYLKQGDYEKALEYFKLAGSIFEEIYGQEHARLASIYHSLGLVHQQKGKMDDALDFFKRSVTVNVKAFGELHQSVAYGYINLGTLYHAVGNYDLAIENYTKSLQIFLPRLGESHISILEIYVNLGVNHAAKESWTNALEYYHKSLSIALEMFGHQHPKVAGIYNHIGEANLQNRSYDEAFEYLTKALQINLAVKGDAHPDIAMIYNNMGDLFLQKGESDLAIEYIQKALEINIAFSGENHSIVGVRYNNLGAAYKSKGSLNEAAECYYKSLHIAISTFGETHSQIASIYSNLGDLFLYHDPVKALEFFEKALEVEQKVNIQKQIAARYWNLGRAHYALNNDGKAISFYQKALQLNPKLQSSIDGANIGLAYARNQQMDKAEAIFAHYEQMFPKHPATFRNWMLYHTLSGKGNKAVKQLEKAVSLGFQDLDWLENEKGLTSIHGLKKYQEVVRLLKLQSRP